MTLFASVATTMAPTRLDPLELFLHADIVVQAVIIGLVLASIWVWAIIVSFSLRMRKVRHRSAAFEEDFWESDQPESLVTGRRRPDNPSARVAAAGLTELRTSTNDGLRDRDGARHRIALAMEGRVAVEADALAARLNFLATTGAVAPFVGLFGTVWGIYHALTGIAASGTIAIDKVAGPVGEALLMTAFGLVVAVPAVLGYNAFTRVNRKLLAELDGFAHDLHAYLTLGARPGDEA